MAKRSVPQAVGGSIPTPPLQFDIQPVQHKDAKAFVERWHYSKCMPTGKNISYGLYASGILYAVIVYGIGVNPYQAKFLGSAAVIEIKRMCRSEPPLDYPLSRLISITSKWARKAMPFDTIVAFADPEQGHEGIVYKASGFTLHGMSGSEWHLEDEQGNRFHRRRAQRYAERKKITIAQARKELGLKRVKTEPKFRWVRNL